MNCQHCHATTDNGLVLCELCRRKADDHVLHDDCAASAPREPKPQPICPRCFTELPVTGVCGVCE